MHQSVESRRQLLVPVTMGGSSTQSPGFHTLKRKLCTSPSASHKSESHGKFLARVTMVYDCHMTKKEDSRLPTVCQIWLFCVLSSDFGHTLSHSPQTEERQLCLSCEVVLGTKFRYLGKHPAHSGCCARVLGWLNDYSTQVQTFALWAPTLVSKEFWC